MGSKPDEDSLSVAAFQQFERSMAREFEAHSKRMDGIHASLHDLRNTVTPLLALEGQVGDLVDDLKNVPRKEDLANLTQHIDFKLDTLARVRNEERETVKQEREVSDRRILRWLAIFGFVITALTFALKFVKIG